MPQTLAKLIDWYNQELEKLEFQYKEAGHLNFEEYQKAVNELDDEFQSKTSEQEPEKIGKIIPFPNKQAVEQTLPWYRMRKAPCAGGVFCEKGNTILVETAVAEVIPLNEHFDVVLLQTPAELEAGTGLSFKTSLFAEKGQKAKILISLSDIDD